MWDDAPDIYELCTLCKEGDHKHCQQDGPGPGGYWYRCNCQCREEDFT